MDSWKKMITWAESHRELWLDCVRIYLGLGLFVRGLVLVFDLHSDFFISVVQKSNEQWLTSALMMHYVTLAHFVGGGMLALGFMTRIAAAVQIPILLGAVLFIHKGEDLMNVGQSLEFSALVLFLLVVLFINGAGRWSLDHAVFGGKHPAPDGAQA
ncbi:MAG: DoxX family protein [Opitutae bacterium]|nr:DoxX family protein [Opitutae bacterium]